MPIYDDYWERVEKMRSNTVHGLRSGRRRAALVSLLTALTAAALMAGGCGDKSSDGDQGVAAVPTSSAAASGGGSDTGSGSGSGGGSMIAYAKCMRDNGVAEFPDPNADGKFNLDGNKLDTNSAQFKSADQTCKSKLPAAVGKGQDVAPPDVAKANLEYAKCMRENGVPKFPDPTAEGGLNINGDTLGVDPNGQIFRDADTKCQPILAKVAGGPKVIQSGAPS
jgi:hypothetical protein